jgi:hypothetical protein
MRTGAAIGARRPARSRWERFRERAPVVTLAAAAVVLLGGLAAVAFVFKPVSLELRPGEVLQYRMTVSMADLGPDGKALPARSEDRVLWIVGLNDGEAAVASGGAAVDRVDLVRLDGDGRYRLLDAAGRPQDTGPALGLFDLNLLRLPTDQAARAGRVTVVHALLPAGRNEVQATVKRTKAGPTSEYLLRFPDAVEWIAGDGRYRRLHKLTCSFAVEGIGGHVKRAVVAAGLQVEPAGDGPIARRQWECRLELVESSVTGEDPRRLRAAAARIAALAAGYRAPEAADGLRSDPVALEPLRQGAAAALARLSRPVEARPSGWWLAVRAADPETGRRIAAAARGAGLAARTVPAGVLLGPWPEQDPNLVARVRQRLEVRSEDLRWVPAR